MTIHCCQCHQPLEQYSCLSLTSHRGYVPRLLSAFSRLPRTERVRSRPLPAAETYFLGVVVRVLLPPAAGLLGRRRLLGLPTGF